MERREPVAAREGGLLDDRDDEGTGYYAPMDVWEVTLVAAAAIERGRDAHDIDPSDGRHRRTLVVAGVDVHDLLETTFRDGRGGSVRTSSGPAPSPRATPSRSSRRTPARWASASLSGSVASEPPRGQAPRLPVG